VSSALLILSSTGCGVFAGMTKPNQGCDRGFRKTLLGEGGRDGEILRSATLAGLLIGGVTLAFPIVMLSVKSKPNFRQDKAPA
jgi:hypothetical protein